MKIIYKTGDLLEADECIIAHGCNARGAMGSGVAKAIRAKWPYAYDCYRTFYKRFGLHTGMNVWAHCTDKLIINCITQETYGRSEKRYVDYDAVSSCFKTINDRVYRSALMSITLKTKRDQLPEETNIKINKILSGQTWSKVFEILEDEAPEFATPRIAMPKIGAGLANGDWNVIEKIVEKECTEVQPVVYVME